jgi:hypothetical protein
MAQIMQKSILKIWSFGIASISLEQKWSSLKLEGRIQILFGESLFLFEDH